MDKSSTYISLRPSVRASLTPFFPSTYFTTLSFSLPCSQMSSVSHPHLQSFSCTSIFTSTQTKVFFHYVHKYQPNHYVSFYVQGRMSHFSPIRNLFLPTSKTTTKRIFSSSQCQQNAPHEKVICQESLKVELVPLHNALVI